MPPKKLRSIAEIWNVIGKPDDVSKRIYQQSYNGTTAALKFVDLIMITSRQEFDQLVVPVDKHNRKKFYLRKIVVSRNSIISKPTCIGDLLSGNTQLVTEAEKDATNKAVGLSAHNKKKGDCADHKQETNTIETLNELCKIHDIYHIEQLFEGRLADFAYCPKNDANGNLLNRMYAAEQVKTATISSDGRVFFKHKNKTITIEGMKSIIDKNMILICIALNLKAIPVKVWIFDKFTSKDMLDKFEPEQRFQPVVNRQRKSENKFANTISEPQFCFDIQSGEKEISRLSQVRIQMIDRSQKNSLQFLNEDESQIAAPSHIVEQKSYFMTRDACEKLYKVKIHRDPRDSNSSVDFRINDVIKVQDKCTTTDKCTFNLRQQGKYPYNPDDFDILQLTNITTKIVYAIPMRKHEENKVVSQMSEQALMCLFIYLSAAWTKSFEKYKYDFSKQHDVEKYVVNCIAASKIPQLSDKDFYAKMIQKNKHLFGSKKMFKQNKLDKLENNVAK